MDGGARQRPTSTVAALAHGVDRSALTELEHRVGMANVVLVAHVGELRFALFSDPHVPWPTADYVVERFEGVQWTEVAREALWTDAYLRLGPLLDEMMDVIPIDVVDVPSPTVLIPVDDGVEILYRTSHGVQIARELGEGRGARLHLFDSAWETFTEMISEEAGLWAAEEWSTVERALRRAVP